MKEFDDFASFSQIILERKKNRNLKSPDWAVCKYSPYGSYRIGVVEYLYIQVFYDTYCYDFKLDFLIKQVVKLEDTFVKEWVDFCLNRIPSYLNNAQKDFEDRLMEWTHTLNLNYEFVLRSFPKSYKFVTPYAYFRYATEHLISDSTINLEYWYVLLLLYMEDEIPQKGDYGIENITEELLDFQIRLIEDFLSVMPLQLKERGLMFLYDNFAKINELDIYEEKFSLSYSKVFSGNKIPMNGTMFLPWSSVEFFDGCFVIHYPSFPKGDRRHKAFRVDDEHSRYTFNDIKSIFLRKLPPLHVKVKDGNIIKLMNEASISSCVTILEHKTIRHPVAAVQRKRADVPKSEKKVLNKAEAQSCIKELKSRFLNYLCSRHLDEYKVFCCIENRINSNLVVEIERSFIFVIKKVGSLVYLAFENAHDSRCTYIFPVPSQKVEESIELIYDFFASNKVNKRQSLAQQIADLKLPGNYNYIRVFHSDYFRWTQKIKFCNQ